MAPLGEGGHVQVDASCEDAETGRPVLASSFGMGSVERLAGGRVTNARPMAGSASLSRVPPLPTPAAADHLGRPARPARPPFISTLKGGVYEVRYSM